MGKACGILLLLSFLYSGCATIVSDSIYPVNISSSPSDAFVTIKDRSGVTINKVRTPTTVFLDADGGYFKKARYMLNFEKEGYLESSQSISAKFDGWYIGNILFGGLIGFLLVDPLTGSMWKFDNYVSGSLYKDKNFFKPQEQQIMEQKKSERPMDNLEKDIKKLLNMKNKGLISDEEYEKLKQKTIMKY